MSGRWGLRAFALDAWEESKVKRDKGGKFASKGEASGGAAKAKSSKTKTAKTEKPPTRSQGTKSAPAAAKPKKRSIDFAKRVLETARKVGPEGKIGRDLVFISHAFKAFRKAHPDIDLDLPGFKDKLVEAWQERKMPLAIANVLEPKWQKDVAESRTERGRHRWDVIDLMDPDNPFETISAAKPKKPAETKAEKPKPLGQFARRIQDIADKLSTPPFSRKVAISQIYDQYGREHPDAGSLADFKDRLLRANQRGEIHFYPLDEPQALDPDTRTRSLLEARHGRFHFVGRSNEQSKPEQAKTAKPKAEKPEKAAGPKAEKSASGGAEHVARLADELKTAFGDKEKFRDAFAKAEKLSAPDAIELASKFSGRKPRSKRMALEIIEKRHGEDLLDAARRRAVKKAPA